MWTRTTDLERMLSAMDLLRARLNNVFGEVERPRAPRYGWAVDEGLPRTNLYDVGDHLEISAEVPGLGREDLKIKIQGNYLEISGTRKSEIPEGYRAHRVERGTTSFTRSFTLPVDVNGEKVEAFLKDGMLRLILPKAETAKPRQITIS